MAKSFYEYVENRVVENFDFEQYAQIINEHVREKGYVTPEEMHEAFERLRGLIGGAARVASGVGHVVKGIGARGLASGAEALKGAGRAVGGAVTGAARGVGGAVAGAGRAVGGAVAGAARGVAQAGKEFGQRVASDYQTGLDVQSKAQIAAHLAQVQNQPWFQALPATQQQNILRAYRQTSAA